MNESKQTTLEIGYAIFRFTMGINLFLHGGVRIPKLDAFAGNVFTKFQDTLLPDILISAFAYSIPFIEILIGILLIFGLFTNIGIILGGLLMATFVLGSCLIENFQAAGSQMVYAIYIFMLAYFIDANKYSIDRVRGK